MQWKKIEWLITRFNDRPYEMGTWTGFPGLFPSCWLVLFPSVLLCSSHVSLYLYCCSSSLCADNRFIVCHCKSWLMIGLSAWEPARKGKEGSREEEGRGPATRGTCFYVQTWLRKVRLEQREILCFINLRRGYSATAEVIMWSAHLALKVLLLISYNVELD